MSDLGKGVLRFIGRPTLFPFSNQKNLRNICAPFSCDGAGLHSGW